MKMFNSAPGFEPVHFIDSYSFGTLKTGTFVDIGGSLGLVSIAVARRHPELRCVVQDRPNVAAKGRSLLPSDLANRVTFQEHDFFEQQPLIGAEVYFLRWILHDWPDKYAVRILRALVPALKPGAKVVVNEIVLPDPGTVSPYKERFYRYADPSAHLWKKSFQSLTEAIAP